MPTSDPGNRATRGRGFTLIELLVVLAIVAIASGLVSVAFRDGAQSRLDEEGARLAALLESARAEARAAGIAVSWEPLDASSAQDAQTASGADFRFVGLPDGLPLPTRWLGRDTRAEVIGARAVVLGPDPVLPPQRIVLRLESRTLVLASDGLAPFAPDTTP